MSTDLVVLEKLTPAAIFAKGGVDDVLAKIKAEVTSQVTDISTEAGRKAVGSLAYKVARSKTALDKMGKDLGQEHYDAWKKITAERSKIEKVLDALKDEVRKPLTDWENAEKDRIAAHEAALIAVEDMGRFDTPPSAADIKYRLDALICLPPREWQEFAKRAADLEQSVIAALNGRYEEETKREAEAAELARLRAEEIARQQKERDDRIAAEAAERARIEAEQKAAREAQEAAAKAEAERLRVEREKAEAVARAEKAEADRKAAAAKAEQDAKDAAEAAERRQSAAIEAERKRVADEQAKVAAETAKREADTKHRAKINNEVLAALVLCGADKTVGQEIIKAIVKGSVPHTKIEY
jgi:hypothetical protein